MIRLDVNLLIIANFRRLIINFCKSIITKENVRLRIYTHIRIIMQGLVDMNIL